MEKFWEWLCNLPLYVANAGAWLFTEFKLGDFTFTPIAIFGAGLASFAGVLLILKVKNLII